MEGDELDKIKMIKWEKSALRNVIAGDYGYEWIQ